MQAPDETIGIAWLNLGGPPTTADLPAFLRSMLSDPFVLDAPAPVRWALARCVARLRARRVGPRYDEIGGGSPLLPHTELQITALLSALGPGFAATAVFRHSPPRAAPALARLVDSVTPRMRRLVAFPAYPQRSHGTTDSALVDLRSAADQLGVEVVDCPSFPDDPDFITSLEEGIRSGLPSAGPDQNGEGHRWDGGTHLLLTSHGLPESALRGGDPYREEVERTATALFQRFPRVPATLAYQSRLGPVRWTGPYLRDEIQRLGRAGVRSLVLAPIAFACENFETLHELDIEAARLAAAAGITTFARAPSPGTHPAFIRCAARLIRSAAAQAGWLDGASASPPPTTSHAHPAHIPQP